MGAVRHGGRHRVQSGAVAVIAAVALLACAAAGGLAPVGAEPRAEAGGGGKHSHDPGRVIIGDVKTTALATNRVDEVKLKCPRGTAAVDHNLEIVDGVGAPLILGFAVDGRAARVQATGKGEVPVRLGVLFAPVRTKAARDSSGRPHTHEKDAVDRSKTITVPASAELFEREEELKCPPDTLANVTSEERDALEATAKDIDFDLTGDTVEGSVSDVDARDSFASFEIRLATTKPVRLTLSVLCVKRKVKPPRRAGSGRASAYRAGLGNHRHELRFTSTSRVRTVPHGDETRAGASITTRCKRSTVVSGFKQSLVGRTITLGQESAGRSHSWTGAATGQSPADGQVRVTAICLRKQTTKSR